jgi:hypothetical protein
MRTSIAGMIGRRRLRHRRHDGDRLADTLVQIGIARAMEHLHPR